MQNITVPDSIPTSEIPVNNLKITVNLKRLVINHHPTNLTSLIDPKIALTYNPIPLIIVMTKKHYI